MYLSVEFVSIMSYILIAYDIKSQERAEASIKYILFGVLASALMLYGLSLLYTISNELQFNSAFLSNLSKAGADAVILPIVLLLAGFFYKISAFPMHYYVPDVYEGAKPKVLAIISTIPKIAGIALLLNFTKVFSFEYHTTTLVWPNFPFADLIAYIAIATLFVANLSAISQKNIKRIFAYSSISHTGFILMGIASFSNVGESSLLYYTIIFAISNVAMFFIIEQWEQNYNIKTIDDLKGYFQNHALSSVLVVILIASFIISSKIVNLNSPLGVRYLSSSFFILSNRLFVTLPLAAISFISSTLIHSHLLLHVKHINVTKTPLSVMLKPFIIVSMSLVCNCMYGSLLSSFIFTFLVIVSWKASNYEILFLK
jgi:NADH-quinone oxidoreductase subunit N